LTSLGRAVDAIAHRLAAAGIVEARREARLLAAEAAGLDGAAAIAHPEIDLNARESERLADFARRRVAREPISRIIGWREFWSLRFTLGPETLDPRPDSETLVAAAVESAPQVAMGTSNPLSVLDLGTGSGCLLLAVLNELPQATGLGIDLSREALAVAAANSQALGLASRVRFQRGDWGAGVGERFDIILCNPPYIPVGEIDGLAPEVAKFDPILSLAGGADGLDAYRRLSLELVHLLASDGRAFIEVGAGQSEAAGTILAGGGLSLLGERADLAGTPRCLIFGRSAQGFPERQPENKPQKTVGNPPTTD
jgi:release factor glutamine methyltransferase